MTKSKTSEFRFKRIVSLCLTLAILLMGANLQAFTSGAAETKYLSSEVAGGFTGVFMGLYSNGSAFKEFREFKCEYSTKIKKL